MHHCSLNCDSFMNSLWMSDTEGEMAMDSDVYLICLKCYLSYLHRVMEPNLHTNSQLVVLRGRNLVEKSHERVAATITSDGIIQFFVFLEN